MFHLHLIYSQIACNNSNMSTDNSLNLSSISDENDNASVIETTSDTVTETNPTKDQTPIALKEIVVPSDTINDTVTSNKTEASTKHRMLLEI